MEFELTVALAAILDFKSILDLVAILNFTTILNIEAIFIGIGVGDDLRFGYQIGFAAIFVLVAIL